MRRTNREQTIRFFSMRCATKQLLADTAASCSSSARRLVSGLRIAECELQ
jgi:hypothetical protein